MIFTFGFILLLIGYIWYRQTEYSKDWRDAVQFALMAIGSLAVLISLLTLAVRYLP
jgi:multisubunit Na+/H+ antiporter MnhB subunit